MVARNLLAVMGPQTTSVTWGGLNTVIMGCAHPIGEYIGRERMASYPSGHRDLTVNQLAQPSGVRIPHSPPRGLPLGEDTYFDKYPPSTGIDTPVR